MSGDNNVLKVDSVEGRPIKFIYEAQSGVIFHVTPMNLPTLRAIQLKAAIVYPYPDKALYEIPDPEEVSFAPGQTSKAEEHPEYQAACRAVDKERKTWADRAVFDYAAECPKYPTKEALVAGFAKELARLRAIAELPEDDYEAVLFHLVLTWNQVALNDNQQYTGAGNEFGRIIQLAIQTVALTPDEVQAGIRFFRPYLQR